MFKKSFKDIGKKYKYFYGPYDQNNKKPNIYMFDNVSKNEDNFQTPDMSGKKRVTLVGGS